MTVKHASLLLVMAGTLPAACSDDDPTGDDCWPAPPQLK